MSQTNTAPSSSATVLATMSVCQLFNSEAREENCAASRDRAIEFMAKSVEGRDDIDRRIANKKDEIVNLEKEKKKKFATEDSYRKTIATAATGVTTNKNLQQVLKTARLSVKFEDLIQDPQDYQLGRKTEGPDGRMRRTAGRTKWLTTPKKLLLDAKKGRVNLTDDQLGELKAQCANGKGTSLTCVVMLARDPRAARAARAAADVVALEAEVAQLRAQAAENEALRAQLAEALQQQQQQQQQQPLSLSNN